MNETRKLPVEHVAALLVEAVRLHREALLLFESGVLQAAADMLDHARLLAEDAASYTLPSGMKLSAAAEISALKKHIAMVSKALSADR